MPIRAIKVLDVASLARRRVLVLELDAPNPVIGLREGMPVDLIFRDGRRERLQLKGLGFASSPPDHAHIIVTAPYEDCDFADVEQIELEMLD